MRGSLKRITVVIGVASALFWGIGMMLATSMPMIMAGDPTSIARLTMGFVEGILIAVGVLCGFVIIGGRLTNRK